MFDTRAHVRDTCKHTRAITYIRTYIATENVITLCRYYAKEQ